MTQLQKLDEQSDLDRRLIRAARDGHTEKVNALLADGANLHADDDWALCLAAYYDNAETASVLLSVGANVHAGNDYALYWATKNGNTETVCALAKHIFAPDSWRGKNSAEIEAQANVLHNKMKASNSSDPIKPEQLRKTGTILADYALRCWEQIRPTPPKLQISPLPAHPRPL